MNFLLGILSENNNPIRKGKIVSWNRKEVGSMEIRSNKVGELLWVTLNKK